MSKIIGTKYIDVDKIQKYLLNPDHDDGGSKDKFFRAFGFTPDEGSVFERALKEHASAHDVDEEKPSPHGVKTVIRCSIRSPDGRDPCILAVWIRDKGSEVQKLVTAYKNPAGDAKQERQSPTRAT